MPSPLPDAPHGIPRRQALAAVGPGWAHLVDRAYDAIELHAVCAADVKEKFGSLRISCASHPIPDRLRRRLAAVERLSLRVCEICGRRGALRDDDPWNEGWVWYKTLCEYHAWRRTHGPRSRWFAALLDASGEVEHDVPPAFHALLDATALGRGTPCDVMRDVLHAARSTVGDAGGRWWIEDATYALERAGPDTLTLCVPKDLERLLQSENGHARAVALLALAHVRPEPVS